nr:MAG TPA: hypothetical protein [Caudoviricetes sp.]
MANQGLQQMVVIAASAFIQYKVNLFRTPTLTAGSFGKRTHQVESIAIQPYKVKFNGFRRIKQVWHFGFLIWLHNGLRFHGYRLLQSVHSILKQIHW